MGVDFVCPGSKIHTCQVPNACKNYLLLTSWQVNLSGTDILYSVELNCVCVYIQYTYRCDFKQPSLQAFNVA